jgi:hypothetical protein
MDHASGVRPRSGRTLWCPGRSQITLKVVVRDRHRAAGTTPQTGHLEDWGLRNRTRVAHVRKYPSLQHNGLVSASRGLRAGQRLPAPGQLDFERRPRIAPHAGTSKLPVPIERVARRLAAQCRPYAVRPFRYEVGARPHPEGLSVFSLGIQRSAPRTECWIGGGASDEAVFVCAAAPRSRPTRGQFIDVRSYPGCRARWLLAAGRFR